MAFCTELQNMYGYNQSIVFVNQWHILFAQFNIGPF